MILDHEKISRIKTALKFHKKGMSISEIARQLKMNRNSVAKYLEILLISGQVEAKKYGISKVYTLSQRVPVSAMLGFSSDMIVMVDGEHRIIQANDQLLQVAGVQRQEVIGQYIENTGIPFLDALPIDSVLEGSAEKRTETIEKHVEQKGCDAFFSIKMVSTIFEDGKVGVTIIIEDISNRRKTEIALANSVHLYESVIGNIQDVFYRSDKNGNLVMASPSWALMLGYDSIEECIGKNIAEKFYFEPQLRKKFLESVYTKGSVSDYGVVLKKKDGTMLYVSTNSHLYFDDTGAVSGVEGIFRDVTDLYNATEQVKQHIAQMEFFSRKLQEFIEFPAGSDVYEKIAADLKSLIPNANIAVCSFNNATTTVTLRSWLFGSEGNTLFYDYVGRDPVGLELPLTTEALMGMREGRLIHLDLSLYEMLFKTVPKDSCNKLEELYDIQKNFRIGFIREGVVLGNAAIFLQKDMDIPDITLVETYAHAASIALQRHIAEDELRKSEELFFNFAEQSPLPIAILDPDGTYRYINRNFTRTFGYDLNDFQKGREWFLLAFPDPDYRKKVISAWKSDLKNSHIGDVRERLFTVRCKDGSVKEVDFRPVTLSDGKQCVIYEDITLRLQARRERQFLSSIVKSTGDTIIGKDIHGNILSWNNAAERLYGYTSEEIVGHNISQLIPRERRHEMDEILSKIKNSESVNSLETFRVKKDGTVIEVAVTISPIMDDDGVVIGASTIARDISFKKAEERLRASEEQYRSLVDNIAVGVYRSTGDPTGRFIWGNTSLVNILGYSSLEMLKKIDVSDIFAKEGGRRGLLEELKQAGFVKNKEILLKRADGKTIHVMVTAIAKFNQKGDLACINGLVEDITSQRQAESQLQIMRNEIVDIIEFQTDATFVIDNEKKVIAWNSAIERLTGIKKADIIGKGDYTHAFAFYGTSRPVLIDLIDSSDEELHEYYAEVKREGTALVAEVFAPALNRGMGAFLWAKASPLVDHSGNRIGAIETIRDISDSKRWQAQTVTRRVSHEGDDKGQAQVMTARTNAPAGQTAELLSLIYLSNALRMAQDGITILDLSARCIWANEALNTLLCTGSSEAITGKSIASYIASEMRKTALDQISEVRRLGHAEFPLSLMTPGGRVPVEARVSTVADPGGELLGYMAILRRINNTIPKQKPRHVKP